MRSSLIVALAACLAASGCAAEAPAALKFAPTAIFPAERTLARPEDGVILADGRLIVADQRHGLVEVAADGSFRPFGRFAAAGYAPGPDGKQAGPNGVHLSADGAHILVADVFTGVIYRTDVARETTAAVYRHAYGVNTAIDDSTGAIWFTQSTESLGETRLFEAVDRAMDDGVLFRLARGPDGRFADRAETKAGGLFFANGFHIDEAGGRLFLSETTADRVLAFDLDLASGTLSGRRVLAAVQSPDNLRIDADGMLWVVSPVANRVMVVDPDTGATRVGFDAQTAAGAELLREWNRRGAAGEARLDLLGPALLGAMPGLPTGIVFDPHGRPAYVAGIGDALVRLER